MKRKVGTIKLKNNEYATVATRIKLFREDCPNGVINTTFSSGEDDVIVFTAKVTKDKSNKDSATSTGHAYGKLKGDKVFEKLETVAVGRALANLGYMAGGEIASSEEMEEFYIYKQQKKEEAIDELRNAQTIEELKEIFMNLGGLMADKEIIKTKDDRKKELTDENN